MTENLIKIPKLELTRINYAFFTNEEGHSDAGYLIHDKKTRNVNIYSSEQKPENGFDPADRVLANIHLCYKELGLEENEHSHRFFMSSYYANMGKSDPLIISCDNLEQLYELKKQAAANLYYEDEDKTNPKRLGLEPQMRQALDQANTAVIRADALIFKGIPNEAIAVLGASGDAHPIMLFDDEQQIACYIAGAHTAIKQNVLQHAVARMLSMGAKTERMRLVIGPGLGPRSYEFGDNALKYFGLQEADKALRAVVDTKGDIKYLIDIKQLVIHKLKGLLASESIYNLDVDTMGFDLYQALPSESSPDKQLKRRTTINFSELNQSGPLFFGARRSIMEKTNDLMQNNTGAHNTVGRHGAGFMIKGRQLTQASSVNYWEHLEAIRQEYIHSKSFSKPFLAKEEVYGRTLGHALFHHSFHPLRSGTDRTYSLIDSLVELIFIPIASPLFAFATLLELLYEASLFALSLFGITTWHSAEQMNECLKFHTQELGFNLLATLLMPLSCVLSILKLGIGIPGMHLYASCYSSNESSEEVLQIEGVKLG